MHFASGGTTTTPNGRAAHRGKPFRKLLTVECLQNVNANTTGTKVSQVLSISRLECELNFNAAFSRGAHKNKNEKEEKKLKCPRNRNRNLN